MSRDVEEYLSLSDDTDSAKGYSSEDDLDSDLDKVLAKIRHDDCDNDGNCEVENLFTRIGFGRIAGTWHIISYLSRLIIIIYHPFSAY